MAETPAPDDPADLLREGHALRALARRLLGDHDAADDVVQDAVVAAWEQRIRPERSGAWLHAVTRRLALLRRRRAGRRRAREAVAAQREEVPSAFDAAVTSETTREVTAAVAALEEPFRSAVVLRFWHGLPPRRIAQRLGVPVNTVRSRIQRGLARLRHALDERHGRDRMGWAVPLAGIALDGSVPARTAALGGLLMGTTGKVAWAAAVAAAAVVLSWSVRSGPERAEVPRGSDDVTGTRSARTARSEAHGGEAAQHRVALATGSADALPDLVVVGRLVDESDLGPLPGASLELVEEGAVVERSEAGPHGRVRLELRNLGKRELLELWSEAEGHAREPRFRSRSRAKGSPPTIDLGELRVPPGTELSGRVVDAQGLPVAGAKVFFAGILSAVDPAAMHGMVLYDRCLEIAETDAAGWFETRHRVVGRSSESMVLAASGQGLGWQSVRPTREANAMEVEIVLGVPADPAITVQTPKGESVPGAAVEALPLFAPLGYRELRRPSELEPESVLGARFVAATDEIGRVTLPGLPRGDGDDWGPLGGYRFRVTADGFRERFVDLELPAGASEHEVVLLPAHPFDLSVSVYGPDEAGRPGEPIEGAVVRIAGREQATDAAGRAVFDAVDHSSSELEWNVHANGWVTRRGRLPAPEPAEREAHVDVEMEPATTFDGTVVDQNGMPVVGARVFVDGPLKGESDDEGRFRIEGLPVTPVRVTVMPPLPESEWAPVQRSDPKPVAEQPKTFMLQRLQAGSATLLVETIDMATGRPVSPEPVGLHPIEEHGMQSGAFIEESEASIGRVRFDGLRPGRYELSLAGRVKRTVVIREDDGVIPVRVEVGRLGRIEAELALAPGVSWPESVRVELGPDTSAADFVRPEGGELLTHDPHPIVWAAKVVPSRSTRFTLEHADPHRVIELEASGGDLFGRALVRVPSGGVARPRIVLARRSWLEFRFDAPCPWHELIVETRREGADWSPPVTHSWMGDRRRLLFAAQAGPLEWRLSSVDPDSGEPKLRASGAVELMAGKASEVVVEIGD